jgi:hypothetical protein
MNIEKILEHIVMLEKKLHSKEVRGNSLSLEDLLFDDFVEFGTSGKKVYKKRNYRETSKV